MSLQRVILHVDMDAYYASVEQRDRPELRNKPVIVGGPGRRGVVTTASYEARPFGVHSAMPMGRALSLCPHAAVVAPRMAHYVNISEQVMDELERFSPRVEPLSLDEAFLDMTGAEKLFGAPDAMARAIKQAVHARTQLGCSVGIACNKFLAKLASDLDKPDGITWVPFGNEATFIAPLEVRRLWGVGPKAAAKLERAGLLTIGDVADADDDLLERQLGNALAHHIAALARGQDARDVEPARRRRSVGSETTLDEDIRGRRAVERILRQQCQRVARHLRRSGLVARGLRVKLRYNVGFRLATRQQALPHACDESATLITTAFELLRRFDLDAPIRLVGAAAYDLQAATSSQQLHLFAHPRAERRSSLEHAVDEIRGRFGDKIGFGRD